MCNQMTLENNTKSPNKINDSNHKIKNDSKQSQLKYISINVQNKIKDKPEMEVKLYNTYM